MTDDATKTDDPQTQTATSALTCHENLDACIDTAIRDGNEWLIAVCFDVLCSE